MTIVNVFGYTLNVPQDAQDTVLPELLSLVCLHMNLCASVGCPCVTGEAAEPLCYESQAGRTRPILHSEGPTWMVTVKAIDTHVVISIHTTDEFVQRESWELYKALQKFPYPISPHSMTRA